MYLVGWKLVAEKVECSGAEVEAAPLTHLDLGSCAEGCKDKSSMFIFGTNDYGVTRCGEKGCSCICELAASLDGTCQRTGHNGYRLYRYEKGMIEKY